MGGEQPQNMDAIFMRLFFNKIFRWLFKGIFQRISTSSMCFECKIYHLRLFTIFFVVNKVCLSIYLYFKIVIKNRALI